MRLNLGEKKKSNKLGKTYPSRKFIVMFDFVCSLYLIAKKKFLTYNGQNFGGSYYKSKSKSGQQKQKYKVQPDATQNHLRSQSFVPQYPGMPDL